MSELTEARAVAFLEEALPTEDRVPADDALLRAVARHALAVREAVPWGRDIPEDVFLAYVLFPRVNNEDLAFYHEAIWSQLRPRLSGLGMEDAVQAVNRWCFEQATYQSTDDRTANALTVIRRGFGRCGEESVLLVSALRACGIPARQVYVPLWSHCDDNHAWVEAWADGAWRYFGACEPELSLDSGWFTAAASKAMLAHTRAWGVLPAGERTEGRAGGAWVINRTAAYAKTALLALTVTEDGRPVPGLRASFQLANMAAFGAICEKHTDGSGRVDLLCGLGTLRVHFTNGTRMLDVDVDAAAQTEYAVDFGAARPFEPGRSTFAQRPPRESRIQPANFPRDAVAAHERWLAEAEAARQARFAMPEGADPLLAKARGNRGVIEAFLRDARFDPADARTLLESLTDKDLGDVTAEVLADALESALPFKESWPPEVWIGAILCPRVKREPLRPHRRWMRARLPAFDTGGAVWDYLTKSISLTDDMPGLLPDLCAALEHGACSAEARDVLFVALCRANGIPARLEPVAGVKQIWRGNGWEPLLESDAPAVTLTLRSGAGRPPTAGLDFSVAALEDGSWRTLALNTAPTDALTLALPAGAYRVTSVARQIDGSLDGIAQDVALAAGEARALTLTLPEDRAADKLIRAALPPLRCLCGDGTAAELPGASAGRPALVACVAPGQEPTEHFLNELLEQREALAAANVAVWLLAEDEGRLANPKLRRVLAEIEGARCLRSPDAAALLEWRRLLNAGELRLPLAVAVDEAGRGLFAFVNYNVGSVASLLRVINAANAC